MFFDEIADVFRESLILTNLGLRHRHDIGIDVLFWHDILHKACPANALARAMFLPTLASDRHANRNVRFGSLADMGAPIRNVRFTPKSGNLSQWDQRLVSATNRHHTPASVFMGA